jgi:general secretion pathway protein B
MSFILDALKKLEHKKKQDSVPDLMTVHEPMPREHRKRSLWPYILLIAFLLNAGILISWLRPWKPEKTVIITRSASEKQMTATETPAADQSSDESLPFPVRAPEPQAVPDVNEAADKPLPGKSESIPVAAEPLPEQVETKPAGIITPPVKEPGEQPVTTESLHTEEAVIETSPVVTVTRPENLSGGVAESMVTHKEIIDINELPLSVREDLPDILIAGHIYSNDPESRIININGHIIREGQTVAEGLKIIEIIPSGAVFSYRGHVFSVRAF